MSKLKTWHCAFHWNHRFDGDMEVKEMSQVPKIFSSHRAIVGCSAGFSPSSPRGAGSKVLLSTARPDGDLLDVGRGAKKMKMLAVQWLK